MVVRIEKILSTLQHEAHRRQIEETMDTPAEESGGVHGSYLD